MTLDPLELVEVPDAASAAQMQCILADLGQMYQERNEALREVARAHHEVLLRLALAADFKDDDTGIHIVRIAYLAEQLALRMGESAGFARLLRDAAPMHDIGKIGVPDRILQKDGPLTEEEWIIMKTHTTMGANILRDSTVPFIQMGARIAASHHEKWDGSGYPLGLRAEEIPTEARITCLVDIYDALINRRVYKRAWGEAEVTTYLRENSAKLFDPRLVELFFDHYPVFRQVQLMHPDQFAPEELP